MTGHPLVSTFVVGTSLMFLGVQGAQVADPLIEACNGLDHGGGHFRPLSITRQRHLLVYHYIAMSHEGLCQANALRAD
jgi:hypothetical protein